MMRQRELQKKKKKRKKIVQRHSQFLTSLYLQTLKMCYFAEFLGNCLSKFGLVVKNKMHISMDRIKKQAKKLISSVPTCL